LFVIYIIFVADAGAEWTHSDSLGCSRRPWRHHQASS